MKRAKLPPRSIAPAGDPIEWFSNSLGSRFPRVEDQFCNAANEKRAAHNARCKAYKERVK